MVCQKLHTMTQKQSRKQTLGFPGLLSHVMPPPTLFPCSLHLDTSVFKTFHWGGETHASSWPIPIPGYKSTDKTFSVFSLQTTDSPINHHLPLYLRIRHGYMLNKHLLPTHQHFRSQSSWLKDIVKSRTWAKRRLGSALQGCSEGKL